MLRIRKSVRVFFRQADVLGVSVGIDWSASIDIIRPLLRSGVTKLEGKTQESVTSILDPVVVTNSLTTLGLPTGAVHLTQEKMEQLKLRAKKLDTTLNEYVHMLSIRLRPYIHNDQGVYSLDALIEACPEEILDTLDSTIRVDKGKIILEMYDGRVIEKISRFVASAGVNQK